MKPGSRFVLGSVGCPRARLASAIGVALLAGSAVLVGCAGMMPKAAPPPSPIVLRWEMPTLAPTAQSPATQAKGGISLAVTPVTYERRFGETYSDAEYTPFLIRDRNLRYFHRTFRPTVAVTPERLGFTVTLVNQLDHVFRGAGAVMSVNIDGTTIAFTPDDVHDFLNQMVLPRGQSQVTIWGPPLSALHTSGTIGLFIYDVVTEVDAAGTPTKKQNFEWYYSYTLDPRSEARLGRVVDMEAPAQ